MAHPLNSIECPNIYSSDSSKSSPDVKDTIHNSFQSPLEVEIDIMSNVEEVEMSLTKGIANIQQRLDQTQMNTVLGMKSHYMIKPCASF